MRAQQSSKFVHYQKTVRCKIASVTTSFLGYQFLSLLQISLAPSLFVLVSFWFFVTIINKWRRQATTNWSRWRKWCKSCSQLASRRTFCGRNWINLKIWLLSCRMSFPRLKNGVKSWPFTGSVWPFCRFPLRYANFNICVFMKLCDIFYFLD